ncbi:MAG: hypothetical protein HQ503_11670 [Rhodospirillales bacterium]|nr:hypothetical protein [Rhodospirillales bacterium]
MAKEFRRITFNKMEIRGAVENALASSEKKIPPGEVVSVKSKRESNKFFYELGIFDYAHHKQGNLTLAEDATLDALITHSMKSGIPLPRASRKEVRDIDGLLCLDIFLE